MKYWYYVTIDPTTPGLLNVEDGGGIVVDSADDEPQIITWQLLLPESKPGLFTGFGWHRLHTPPKGTFGPAKLSADMLELNLPDHNKKKGHGWVYQLAASVDGHSYTTNLTRTTSPPKLAYGTIMYTSSNPTIKNK